MTDIQINVALALAIGWTESHLIKSGCFFPVLYCRIDSDNVYPWKEFSYTDARVIWPIAEKFDCFPVRQYRGSHGPYDWMSIGKGGRVAYADTAAKAVALAVIGSKT